MAAENWKDLHGTNNSYHPVTLDWFSIQILVNYEILKLSLNLSLTRLRAQIEHIKLFSCSQKVDHVTNFCKRPIDSNHGPN